MSANSMFSRFKTRVLNAVSPEPLALPATTASTLTKSSFHAVASTVNPSTTHHHSRHNLNPNNLPDKFEYSRPPFLQLLTPDELKASADHNVRPIIVPRDISVMPWNSGYAECVNSGKSEWNEDQAAFQRHRLTHPTARHPDLPYIYFGTFDGHAGYGAALAAANQFHHILHEKLVDVIDMLMPSRKAQAARDVNEAVLHPMLFHKMVTRDELIIGALESAFADMDAMLAEDRDKYRNAGGCTALVTLFILGKMFVANAGDSRAILCQRKLIRSSDESSTSSTTSMSEPSSAGDSTIASDAQQLQQPQQPPEEHIYSSPLSFDHTPDTERPRLLSTAQLNPTLMGHEYVAMEYGKRPQSRDLGQRILYRRGNMKGWAYKTLTPDDLRMPLVTGEGKRSRLLGTIGVTRGFGDHDLRALYTQVLIKPFLSCHPEVIYRDLTLVASIPSDANEDGDYGILVMATDGLWDVSDPDGVARSVFRTLDKNRNEKHRYTMAAQDLVARSRGRINESGHWRLADSKAAATVDDISVMVVPVFQYYQEYIRWERECLAQERRVSVAEDAAAAAVAAAATGASIAQVLNGDQTLDAMAEELDDDDDEDEETIVIEMETDGGDELLLSNGTTIQSNGTDVLLPN